MSSRRTAWDLLPLAVCVSLFVAAGVPRLSEGVHTVIYPRGDGSLYATVSFSERERRVDFELIGHGEREGWGDTTYADTCSFTTDFDIRAMCRRSGGSPDLFVMGRSRSTGQTLVEHWTLSGFEPRRLTAGGGFLTDVPVERRRELLLSTDEIGVVGSAAFHLTSGELWLLEEFGDRKLWWLDVASGEFGLFGDATSLSELGSIQSLASSRELGVDGEPGAFFITGRPWRDGKPAKLRDVVVFRDDDSDGETDRTLLLPYADVLAWDTDPYF